MADKRFEGITGWLLSVRCKKVTKREISNAKERRNVKLNVEILRVLNIIKQS